MRVADTAPQAPESTSLPGEPPYISAWEASDFLGNGLTPWSVIELCRAGVIASTEWRGFLRVETTSLRAYAERLPGFDKDKPL